MSDQNAPDTHVVPEVETATEARPTNPNLIRNIVLGIIGLLVVLALIFGLIWLGKQVFAPVSTSPDDQRVVETDAPIDDSQPVATQEAPVTGISEQTVLDLGSIGAFHAVYDYNVGQWTLGIWEESAVRSGTGLSEFKLKATSVSFVMPANGVINNSAGHISVNSQEWVLGNPAQSPSGDPDVKKGDTITIWTDGPNESAGFQIWFK